MDNKRQNVRNRLEQDFIAPLMADYVRWILIQATKRNIRTLYFLARDGYLLREIALALCKKHRIPIECKYLYCSRAALRMPTYHLIGEEAMELLLSGGYQVTLGALLDRPGLSEKERTLVKTDCGLENVSEDTVLSPAELDTYRNLFRNSSVYREFIYQKSKKAYTPAITYFQQEGLLDADTVAIVDSGWNGSLQRSLRQLLQSAGFRGQLVGFYYGMYKTPAAPQDGIYLTWFFNATRDKRNRAIFNFSLFECLLSAPHGMTVGYTFEQGIAVPILLQTGLLINEISNSIKRIVDHIYSCETVQKQSILDEQIAKKQSYKLIYRYMVRPTFEEANVLGNYLFCDDITEGFHVALVDEAQCCQLREHLFLPRILRKLLKRRNAVIQLYWPYGTIALLPKWQQWWYRWNELAWQWLRILPKQ